MNNALGALAEPAAGTRPQDRDRTWRRVALIAGITLAGLLLLHWPVVRFTWDTWADNQTFAHGFVIFPLSGWLVWRRRREIMALSPTPQYWALALLALGGFAWELGFLGKAIVVQQYALVALIPAAALALFGYRVVRAIAFPLFYLFLAVPFGEMLIPHMMAWTANFTVLAVQHSGVPVFQQGPFFELPNGDWSVVEACSGLRYLIASYTLGLLYAYLTYRTLWRRVLFVGASVAVPVVANWLRAYMIVMIGYLSNMRLAVGIDHIIYGWILFGIVMALLFWLGSLWREDLTPGQDAPAAASPATCPRLVPIGLAAAAVLAVSALFPADAQFLARRQSGPVNVTLAAPRPAPGWAPWLGPVTPWVPHFKYPRATLERTYVAHGALVTLFVYYYRDQTQRSKLIRSQNVILSTNPQYRKHWQNIGQAMRRLPLDAGRLGIAENRLRGRPPLHLLVWHWFWIDHRFTTNPYLVKFLEAKSMLLGKGDDAALVVMATPYAGKGDARAERTLRAFAAAWASPIRAALQRTAAQADGGRG
ncbi:MAG: exosortase A [Betaproteobacteria bacterium]|nr:exosortase A [Betaproteobacteria bacterium]